MTAFTTSAISGLFDTYLESSTEQAKNKAFNELWRLLSSHLQTAANPAPFINHIKLLHSTIIDYQLNLQTENERTNARRKNDLLVYLFNSLAELPNLNHANSLFVEIKSYLTAARSKSTSINNRIKLISKDTLAHASLSKSVSGISSSKRPLPEDDSMAFPIRTKSAKSSIADLEDLAATNSADNIQTKFNQSTLRIAKSLNLTPPATPNITAIDIPPKAALSSKTAPAVLPKPTFLPVKDATEFGSELAKYLSLSNQKEKQKLLTRLGAYLTNLINDVSLDKTIKMRDVEKAINSFAIKHIESKGFDSNLEAFILAQRGKLAVQLTNSMAKLASHSTPIDKATLTSLSPKEAKSTDESTIAVSTKQLIGVPPKPSATAQTKDASNTSTTKKPNTTTNAATGVNIFSPAKHNLGAFDKFQTSINSTKMLSNSAVTYPARANLQYAIEQATHKLTHQCQLLEKEKSGFCLFASRKTAKIQALKQFAQDLTTLQLQERDLCQTINNRITALRKEHPQLDAGFFSNRTGELIDKLGAYLRSVIISNEKINLNVFIEARNNGGYQSHVPVIKNPAHKQHL